MHYHKRSSWNVDLIIPQLDSLGIHFLNRSERMDWKFFGCPKGLFSSFFSTTSSLNEKNWSRCGSKREKEEKWGRSPRDQIFLCKGNLGKGKEKTKKIGKKEEKEEMNSFFFFPISLEFP